MITFWRGTLGVLLFLFTAAAVQANEFVGTWRVDLGATVGMNDSYSRIDDTTVLKTTTTTIGRGARDMGSLQINADGTYALRYWEYELIYRTPVIAGTWRPVAADDPFAAMGAIELLGAKPDPNYAEKDRKWYVFRKEDGSVEARYPPYDGFAKIRLSKGGKSPAARPVPPAPVQAVPAPAAPAPVTSAANAPAAAVPLVQAAKPRTSTPDQVRQALTGKTVAEVQALLGQPAKVAYGTYYFNGVDAVFPHCAGGCNWKSFAIQFGGPGETANSIELQYWPVE